jgi:hypothetical protein
LTVLYFGMAGADDHHDEETHADADEEATPEPAV